MSFSTSESCYSGPGKHWCRANAADLLAIGDRAAVSPAPGKMTLASRVNATHLPIVYAVKRQHLIVMAARSVTLLLDFIVAYVFTLLLIPPQ